MNNEKHIKLVLKRDDETVDTCEFDIDYDDERYADSYSEALVQFQKNCPALEDDDVYDEVSDALLIDEDERVEFESDGNTYTIEQTQTEL